jgi:SAM-dependent methyltransferase
VPEARRSVVFDRVAEDYDRTRGLTEEGVRRTTELLVTELGPRGRALEIGVGTGQVALPLHRAGIRLVGLDLSMPMMRKLTQKAGGHPPFPLVRGDATRLPFAADAFGGAYFRWVLHLIPDWRAAMAELVRVVRPGGVVVGSLGGYGGPRAQIQDRFAQVAGVTPTPAGLPWDDWPALEAAMAELGARPRELPTFIEVERDDVEEFMRALEHNRFSWTWPIPEEVRLRAAAETRAWAVGRLGPLDRIPRHRFEFVWRAYDVGVSPR